MYVSYLGEYLKNTYVYEKSRKEYEVIWKTFFISRGKKTRDVCSFDLSLSDFFHISFSVVCSNLLLFNVTSTFILWLLDVHINLLKTDIFHTSKIFHRIQIKTKTFQTHISFQINNTRMQNFLNTHPNKNRMKKIESYWHNNTPFCLSKHAGIVSQLYSGSFVWAASSRLPITFPCNPDSFPLQNLLLRGIRSLRRRLLTTPDIWQAIIVKYVVDNPRKLPTRTR